MLPVRRRRRWRQRRQRGGHTPRVCRLDVQVGTRVPVRDFEASLEVLLQRPGWTCDQRPAAFPISGDVRDQALAHTLAVHVRLARHNAREPCQAFLAVVPTGVMGAR